jgi:hypothetical protein
MPPKPPDISQAVIEPHLSTTALTAQDIRAPMRNDEWITIEPRKAQLVLIEQFTKTECGVTFDSTVLAELFELARSRVREIRVMAERKQPPPYHPPLCPTNRRSSCTKRSETKLSQAIILGKGNQSILSKPIQHKPY